MSPLAKTKKKPHVVVGGAGFRCLNCGTEESVQFPVRLEVYAVHGKCFERSHKLCKPSEAGAKRFEWSTPAEWKASWDTGISSLTIWSFFTGQHGGEVGIPHDPEDFGRCFRLLAKLPGWRASLPRLAERFPEWAPLVERWAHMERLYEEELPTGSAPRLYAFMRPLVERGLAIARAAECDA